MLRIILSVAVLLVGVQFAHAESSRDAFMASFGGAQQMAQRATKHRVAYSALADFGFSSAHGNNAKPRKWCGWYMRQKFGGGPAYNVAWNWARRGVPAAPHVGAIVVWRHHVGYISGRSAKGWIITSGNDGNAVRSRVRSIRNAVIRSI